MATHERRISKKVKNVKNDDKKPTTSPRLSTPFMRRHIGNDNAVNTSQIVNTINTTIDEKAAAFEAQNARFIAHLKAENLALKTELMKTQFEHDEEFMSTFADMLMAFDDTMTARLDETRADARSMLAVAEESAVNISQSLRLSRRFAYAENRRTTTEIRQIVMNGASAHHALAQAVLNHLTPLNINALKTTISSLLDDVDTRLQMLVERLTSTSEPVKAEWIREVSAIRQVAAEAPQLQKTLQNLLIQIERKSGDATDALTQLNSNIQENIRPAVKAVNELERTADRLERQLSGHGDSVIGSTRETQKEITRAINSIPEIVKSGLGHTLTDNYHLLTQPLEQLEKLIQQSSETLLLREQAEKLAPLFNAIVPQLSALSSVTPQLSRLIALAELIAATGGE
jgi:hypothetical protein